MQFGSSRPNLSFLRKVISLCSKKNIILIFDEYYRSGKLEDYKNIKLNQISNIRKGVR